MQQAVELNRAFIDFTRASKSLEQHYEQLSKRVDYLTSELEKKNAQLNESKEYLSEVLLSIGESIIVLDKDEKVNMMNRAAEELLCLFPGDVRGMAFKDLDIDISEEGNGSFLYVKGKKHAVIFSRSVVSGSDGQVMGYVILIKDISRIKELEKQDERNQRLISMGEMAAKIVHEIRSPLCSIELFSNMLSNDLKDTVHAEMAGGISTGIKSLNTILTNMLYFAKHQKPRFMELKPLDIIEECIGVLAPLIDVRHIKVFLNVSDAKVAGDSELLKQVFMNIILNAIQAMPDGGSLCIESSVSGSYSVVSVTDEGKGILEENIEKIFNPFFSTKDKGSGLGLAISNKIMQSHEGSIKAFRNTGKGSTFSVYFLSEKMPEAQDRKKNSAGDGDALRNIYTENDSFQIPLVRSI